MSPSFQGWRDKEPRLRYRLCEQVKPDDKINWSLYKTTKNTLVSSLKQTETEEEEARVTCFCYSCDVFPRGKQTRGLWHRHF